MHYQNKHILTENTGNNTFAWEMRMEKDGKSPTLMIPALVHGTIEDIKIGTDIVFEEIKDRKLQSCVGLENFVQLDIVYPSYHPTILPITIFDNHNHALYFWIDAVRQGIIHPGFELIHIDEHSDLWDNTNILNLETAITDPDYAWNFTNLSCNVGNYILPAIECGLVGNMIRIENEYQIDAYMDYIPSQNSVLNLDIDIFAPELDHIPTLKKIRIIQNLLTRVKYVTIATSPFFIEQGKAIQILQQILSKN